jgi:tetratricopeptide (TPR) repeat protein
VGLTNPIAISTLFILFLLLVLLFRVGINKPFGKALGLFLLFLAPALNIIPTPRMSSPHYGFIALIPFSVLILFILEWLLSHDRITAKLDWDSITSLTLRSRMTIFFFFLWLIAAGIATFQNGSRFRNDQTLFTMEAVHDPNFHEANFYLGTYYLKQKNYTAAENAFRATLQPSSGFIAYSERYSSLTNLAAVYYATNRFTDADIALQLAQKAAPPAELSHVFYDRAIIASQQRQYTTVIQLLDKPEFQTNPLALLMLADAFHYLGRNKEALATLEHSRLYWNAAQRKQIDRLIQQTQKEEVN